MTETGKGITASLTASCLFGLLYFYATLLAPLSGLEIYSWRMILTVPVVALFVFRGGHGHLARSILSGVRARPVLVPGLCLSSFLLGFQLWLFMWAPLNGKALDVSLGYLLMPLVMVACGKILYKEQLRPFQKLAVACAALGVGYKVWQVGTFSLESSAVCLGFPAYFILRKTLKTDHIGGLLVDMALALPAAACILWESQSGISAMGANPKLLLLIPGLGVISAFAFALFTTAGQILPLGLFGLLSYMEPALLVVVALLLGEAIPPHDMPTYAGVFLAIVILTIDGWMGLSNKTQSPNTQN